MWVGYIEVFVDVVCLVGVGFFGVICEIMNEDGMMVWLLDLVVFV